jgi:hypothetical protein
MEYVHEIWNVEHLCRVESLATVSRELSRYRIDLVGGAGGQMRGQWHRTHRRKKKENHEFTAVTTQNAVFWDVNAVWLL